MRLATRIDLASVTVFAVAFMTCLLVLVLTERYYGGLLWGWDAQFYYARARSLAVQGNLDITDDLPLTATPAPFGPSPDGRLQRVPRDDENRIVSKYPVGLSLAEIPWLAAGRGIEKLTREPRDAADGYEPIVLRTVAGGLAAYGCLGLALTFAWLRRAVAASAAAAASLAAWLGTSAFYYTAVFPYMAHALGATLVAAALWLATRLDTAPDRPVHRHLTAIGSVLALLLLVRPQQLTLAVALALSHRHILTKPVRLWGHGLIAGIALISAAWTLQVVVNGLTTGQFTFSVYAAGGEGFSLAHPDIATVMWSAGRGLLVYSPIVVMAGIGLWCNRSPSPVATAALLHALAQIWLIATWSSPGQGDAFGARMWVECTPVVALGLSRLFDHARTLAARAAASLGVALSIAWTNILVVTYIRAGIPESISYAELGQRTLTALGLR